MNENNICKDWRELNTPFGKLYIEPWEWHLNNKFPFDDDGRITIYDSRGDWLDYFPLDYFYEVNGSETTEEEAEKAYYDLVEMLKCGAEADNICEFIGWLGLYTSYVGPDKEEASKALSDGHPEELLPDELETNEYVNHIGNNYIIILD